jgi:hypothetical protein
MIKNALTALSEMSIDEYFEQIGEIVKSVLIKQEESNRPLCPDDMSTDDVLLFFTHKSYSDLNQGIAAGRYPQPVTSAGFKRVWRKKDWEIWQAGIKKRNERRGAVVKHG